jgi:hypothetical protein
MGYSWNFQKIEGPSAFYSLQVNGVTSQVRIDPWIIPDGRKFGVLAGRIENCEILDEMDDFCLDEIIDEIRIDALPRI